MNTTLKIISLLLTYPSRDIQKEAGELASAVRDDQGLKPEQKKYLVELIEDIAGLDLYEAQERYVHLFDRTRTVSLHLFEHVHGESRDRGQAMVDLMTMYEDNGFEIDTKELPDYLPLFLEFVSTRSDVEIEDLLGQTSHIYAVLSERLKKRKSIYAGIFDILQDVSEQKPDEKLVAEILSNPEDDPDDLEAMDQIWEEEAVTFGGNAGEEACGPDRMRTQMRASKRKPVDPQSARSHPMQEV
ncbi:MULTISPECIES: nitrate reductase molybdenum cofactor assembly chaperone [unclassified Lentilitoribacter]|jgi:nitrate reductase delta subunit|uniref:nitrate reductase molybdenum cofactor assembly chaperone n=1 Tax=unclassified Lentilitoribacter TaxID=2647570 RepID=UPI0013A6C969|nr:nitrate reductase molybdenum cofactor assembly chaperone [Lentilitoribacter sp. Alg239-R112]